MIYEALIINKEIPGFSAKRGEICAVMPKGHIWGNAELTDRFAIIEIDLPSQEHAEELQRCDKYKYDTLDSKFKRIEDSIEFIPSVFITKSEFTPQQQSLSDTIADSIDPNWRNSFETSCEFLFPPTDTYPDDKVSFGTFRKRWVRKLEQIIELNGVRDLIKAFIYGDFGDLITVAKSIKKVDQKAILQSGIFTVQEVQWIKTKWGY